MRLNQLGEQLVVKFGDTDVSDAIVGGTVSNAMNQLGTATLEFDAHHWLMRRIDWHDEVHVFQGSGASGRPLMRGDVTTVVATRDRVIATCVSIATFNERAAGGFAHSNCVPDLIYSLARGGGLPADRINIQLDGAFTEELVEVSVPVLGAVISERAEMGRVVIAPRHEVKIPSLEPDFRGDFDDASAVATTYVLATRLYDAQEQALERIDLALAWIAVRLEYSFALLPDGTINEWRRPAGLMTPRRGRKAFVRGVTTGRWWLRDAGETRRGDQVRLDSPGASTSRPAFPRDAPVELAQAVLACSRAASASDPVSCATAIWEALEFYCSGTSVPKMFTRQELKELKRQALGAVEEGKRSRLEAVIGQLNTPPLLTRLRRRIALDGVPVSEAEFNLLVNLRAVRNNAVHGRAGVKAVTDEELRLGVAVCSRLIVHRAAQLGVDGRR